MLKEIIIFAIVVVFLYIIIKVNIQQSRKLRQSKANFKKSRVELRDRKEALITDFEL